MSSILEMHENLRVSLTTLYNEVSSVLDNRAYIIKNKKFGDVLEFIKDRNMIHYTRLAAAMGLKDASNVSRWFHKAVTPDTFKQNAALLAIKSIIDADVKRIEIGKNPIGGKDLKFHPQEAVSFF